MHPEPDLGAEEIQHGARVRAMIMAQLEAAGGWLPFERYMELALYAPGLGYYSAGARKLGRGGDFTTAPEISPLFGACVANQCAQVLEELGGGSILEVGAGSGRLAVDALRRLEALGRLPAQYLILEVSADLRDRQQALIRESIPHLLPRFVWLDAPPVPPIQGVILANEVLDALPVRRFRWGAAQCAELGVIGVAGGFAWAPRPDDALRVQCNRLAAAAGDWDEDYVSEYCPRLPGFVGALLGALERGAALWFDYGLPRPQYYLAERHGGTLICHFRQRAHDDPFLHPGLQDISAWVDFTTVAEACTAAGCELEGFTTQAHFLAGLGIDLEMQRAGGADPVQGARLAQQARTLMLPGEMGERFKVMGVTRAMRGRLAGFALRDLRDSL